MFNRNLSEQDKQWFIEEVRKLRFESVDKYIDMSVEDIEEIKTLITEKAEAYVAASEHVLGSVDKYVDIATDEAEHAKERSVSQHNDVAQRFESLEASIAKIGRMVEGLANPKEVAHSYDFKLSGDGTLTTDQIDQVVDKLRPPIQSKPPANGIHSAVRVEKLNVEKLLVPRGEDGTVALARVKKSEAADRKKWISAQKEATNKRWTEARRKVLSAMKLFQWSTIPDLMEATTLSRYYVTGVLSQSRVVQDGDKYALA